MGRKGLLVDIDTGVMRQDHVLVLRAPSAVCFLGFSPRVGQLWRFAFDEAGDTAPFIARCRTIVAPVKSGRLPKMRRANIPRAECKTEDRILHRLLVAEALAKAGYDPGELPGLRLWKTR